MANAAAPNLAETAALWGGLTIDTSDYIMDPEGSGAWVPDTVGKCAPIVNLKIQ